MKKITCIFTCLLCFSSISNATTVLYQDFYQLIDSSQYIVGGKISKIKSKKYKNKDIYTVITLINAYTIGSAGTVPLESKAKIRYRGGVIELYNEKGEVNGFEELIAHGTPKLAKGDKVILFVSDNGVADMPINGWGQGVFFVGESGAVLDAEKNAVVGLSGADIMTKTLNGHIIISNQAARKSSSSRSKLSKNNSAVAQIVESDGGMDILVDIESEAQSKLSAAKDLYAMDVANFTSMIQERKAMTKDTGRSSNNANQPNVYSYDKTALSELPDVETSNSQQDEVYANSVGGSEEAAVDNFESSSETEKAAIPIKKPSVDIKEDQR